MQLET